jgi:hypothetical protein
MHVDERMQQTKKGQTAKRIDILYIDKQTNKLYVTF